MSRYDEIIIRILAGSDWGGSKRKKIGGGTGLFIFGGQA